MDLGVAFGSMFLLFFGLTALGLGLFTAYFGAGKSRWIGIILSLIGIVLLAIFAYMTGEWDTGDITDSFVGVIGIILGAVIALLLVFGLMIVIKEKEVEVTDIEEIGRGSPKPEEGEEKPEGEKEQAEEVPEAPIPESPEEPEAKMEEPAPEEAPDEEMAEYLKEMEEKRIVKDEWEKVKDKGTSTMFEGASEELPVPEEIKEEEPGKPEGKEPGKEEPGKPGKEEPGKPGEEEPGDVSDVPPAPEETEVSERKEGD